MDSSGWARWASLWHATSYRQGLRCGCSTREKSAWLRSSLGAHKGERVLAGHLGRVARELARDFHADDAGLLRLLPRLPTLLFLQEVINGLVSGAVEAMTMQGRRPELVRWTWQRDVTHHFHFREQATRFFADGVVALCIRTRQRDGGALEQWYGCVLLSTDLDDERLMRYRLERLLRWRESPERWPVYQHMLPVLILARSQRQRDHWQHASRGASLMLRLDPLAGGVACLAPEASACNTPWRLAWRNLATDQPSHLRDLLTPLPRAAFPSALPLEAGEDGDSHAGGQVSTITSFPGRPRRVILGNLACRVAHLHSGEQEEPHRIALLGLRLTSCQWRILRLLLAHPLLSDAELAVFLGLELRSVRGSLYDLHVLGCLEPLATEADKRWRLCECGLRLLAAANHLRVRSLAREGETEGSPLRQRGEACLLHGIRHTTGVYGFFAALVQASHHQLDQEVCWWETGVVSERRYRVGEQWYNLRPDALAGYRKGGEQEVRFWLEWDRGTMNARDLAIKFASYAHYLASRKWVREFPYVPRLFCVVPEIAQERRVHRVARMELALFPARSCSGRLPKCF